MTAIVELALQSQRDLRLRSVAVQSRDLEDAAADVGYASGGARVAIAVRYGSELAGTAGRTRDIVRRTLGEQFGWSVRAVAIDVVDVFVVGTGGAGDE